DATRFDCHSNVRDKIVPIGKPIGNAQCYILDEMLRPVPIGVTGELYVASPGLARGYTDDAGSTGSQFMPNPFSMSSGSRMYRTGDLGRYTTDGTIHFVGRADRQVKVRGNRVELEEIEIWLASHPAVRHCCVDHRTDARGSDNLVAFVELQDKYT